MPPANDAAAEARYRAPALDKGLDILELLADRPHGLTRTEISLALNRNPSEIYRMLERLVARRYVCRTTSRDHYALSSKSFSLAKCHPPLRVMLDVANPPMARFTATTSQSCYIGMFHDGAIQVIAQADSTGELTIAPKPGVELGMFDTVSGTVLLAFQNNDVRASMIQEARDRYGDRAGHVQISDQCLETIRRMGYARMASRIFVGVENISVPVLDQHRHAVAVATCPFVSAGTTSAGTTIEAACNTLLAMSREVSDGLARG